MPHPTVDELYLREIDTQCSYARFALGDAEEQLNRDIRRFWYSIQAFLIAVANISKIMWPAALYSDRGNRLRERLSISEHSCLKSRSFRNHFEHFDERVQHWFDSPRPPGFADFCIGGDDSFGGGLGKPHYMRNFNPTTYTLYFQGEEYHLRPVIAALKELHERAKNEI
jgi:hypothetical protein